MDFFFFIQNNNLRMTLNFITSPHVTEDRCRNYISKMFTSTCSIIDDIFEQAEKDIIKSNYEKEIKEFIIENIEIRVNKLLSKFEDLLFQFNYKYKQNLEVPLETFGHIDKLDSLLKLDDKVSEINMDCID
jgi:hypothetical protein